MMTIGADRGNPRALLGEDGMLDSALKVVEAARSLGLERRDGLTRSTRDKLSLARALEGLMEAIEVFDRETGREMGQAGPRPPARVARPDFATPPQLDERLFVERQELLEQRMAPLSANAAAPEPDFEFDPAGTEDDRRIETPAFSPLASIPASTAAAAMAHLDAGIDLGDMEFDDGAESVADFLESLDAIADKLEYAVARVGWTPRLRSLAEAANIARAKMTLDVGRDGVYVRVPAESWSNLSVAVADAAMDMDNRLTPPVPRIVPKDYFRHDRERRPQPT